MEVFYPNFTKYHNQLEAERKKKAKKRREEIQPMATANTFKSSSSWTTENGHFSPPASVHAAIPSPVDPNLLEFFANTPEFLRQFTSNSTPEIPAQPTTNSTPKVLAQSSTNSSPEIPAHSTTNSTSPSSPPTTLIVSPEPTSNTNADIPSKTRSCHQFKFCGFVVELRSKSSTTQHTKALPTGIGGALHKFPGRLGSWVKVKTKVVISRVGKVVTTPPYFSTSSHSATPKFNSDPFLPTPMTQEEEAQKDAFLRLRFPTSTKYLVVGPQTLQQYTHKLSTHHQEYLTLSRIPGLETFPNPHTMTESEWYIAAARVCKGKLSPRDSDLDDRWVEMWMKDNLKGFEKEFWDWYARSCVKRWVENREEAKAYIHGTALQKTGKLYSKMSWEERMVCHLMMLRMVPDM